MRFTISSPTSSDGVIERLCTLGEITGVLDRADCTEENIMQLAVGRKIPAAKAAFAN